MKYSTKLGLTMLTSTLTLVSACGGGDNDTPAMTTPVTALATKAIENCTSGIDASQTLTLTNRNNLVDYTINCQLPVKGSLIIEPGVTVEFDTQSGLNITGSVQALGTADKPITLTGITKTVGAWDGVFVNSADITNELSYVTVDYAGGGFFNSNGDEGGVIIYGGAALDMNNSVIRNSEAYGINASYTGSDISLENNTITASEAPMIVKGAYPTTISGGSYTGNDLDAIIVKSDQISGEHTWSDIGVPYRISNQLQVIPSSGILTIEPGVTVEFEADGQLYINEGASGTPPSLIAVGTADNPILFTGVNKVSGAWKGIYFDSPSPINEIAHATIEYASNLAQKGAIEVWAGTVLNVHDVTFKDISKCSVNGGNPGYLVGVTTSNLTHISVGTEICEGGSSL